MPAGEVSVSRKNDSVFQTACTLIRGLRRSVDGHIKISQIVFMGDSVDSRYPVIEAGQPMPSVIQNVSHIRFGHQTFCLFHYSLR